MADLPYRFSTVTPDDHQGLLYIAAFLTLTYSNLTFITRTLIKWKVFGLDDWTLSVAQVAFITQFALLITSLRAGLGRSFDLLTSDAYLRMTDSQYGYQVILFLTLGLSKCAAALLVQRLFTRDAKKFWIICTILTGIMAVWTVFAAFMISAGCSPTSTAPSTEAQICPSIFVRYEIIVITDAITDVLLVIVPAYLVWQLQMASVLKLQVLVVFAFRLPLVPLSILGLAKFSKSLHSSNPGVDRTAAILYQQSQLCYSLIAATVPCLKSFFRSFDTGSGVKVNYSSNAYGSSGYGRGGGESYRMESLSGTGSALRSHTEDKGDIKVSSKPFTRDGKGHGHGLSRARSTSKVTTMPFSSDRPNEEDTASHGSQELIIRRDVQWEVRSEDAR